MRNYAGAITNGSAFRRAPSQVMEREILRIVATVQGADSKDAFERARHESLKWVSNRTAGALPKEAWAGQEFDHLAGGRPVLARSVVKAEGAIWAIRADEPDKNMPARSWITEVTIGMPNKGLSQMSIRLMASSPEPDLAINPTVPGVVRQIANHCGLLSGKYPITEVPKVIETGEDSNRLVQFLENQNRRLPVIVASGDERAPDPDKPLIDTESLSKATLGLAHVVVLPAKRSYSLSKKFGKSRSVFHGAIRMYMCGFNDADDPYDHPLFFGHRVRFSPKECEAELRRLAARESVRRTRLGHDVLLFADVRREAARLQRESATELVIRGNRLAEGRIDALEQEVRSRKSEVEALEAQVRSAQFERDQAFELATQEEERAKEAENTQQGLRARVQALYDELSPHDRDHDLELPQTWQDFAEWCNIFLAGRLVLATAARRGIKKAQFCDAKLAAECVLWLATEYIDIRMHGLDNARDAKRGQVGVVEGQDGRRLLGIENSSCGKDEFSFEWQGRRLNADWHIKNSNTRDPKRCLRIYYCYDEITQQVVIAEMPAHRTTGAT